MTILKKNIQPIQGDPEFYRNISSDGCKIQERLHCSQGQGYRWQPGSQVWGVFRITLNTAWHGWIHMVMYTHRYLVLSPEWWLCTCVVKLCQYFLDCSFVRMQLSRCGVCSFHLKGFQGFNSGAGAFFGRAVLPACPPMLIETRSLNWPWSPSTQLGWGGGEDLIPPSQPRATYTPPTPACLGMWNYPPSSWGILLNWMSTWFMMKTSPVWLEMCCICILIKGSLSAIRKTHPWFWLLMLVAN